MFFEAGFAISVFINVWHMKFLPVILFWFLSACSSAFNIKTVWREPVMTIHFTCITALDTHLELGLIQKADRMFSENYNILMSESNEYEIYWMKNLCDLKHTGDS